MRIPRFEVETRSDLRSLVVETLPIFLIFTALSRVNPVGLRVPPETFEGWSIVAAAIREPRFLVFVLLPVLVLLPFWRRLAWSEIEGASHGVRPFVAILCVASAFTFASYDYNLFLDQPHFFDRLLLLALAAGAWYHPLFAVLYGAVGMLVVTQFEFPLGHYTWLDKRILFVALQLLTAFLMMAVIRRQRAILFAGLAASILAANYVIPGIAKIRTEWILQDNLANLAVMTHLNGWLGRVDTERYLALVQSLGWVNVPLLWLTLVVELGALFLFIQRRYMAFIIIGTVGLHGGVFLSSGICFWKWVLFNLGVWWMIMRAPGSSVLFTRGFLLISMFVILTSPFHARPAWLVWFDAPADEYTEVEVRGVSGQSYHVERGFFEPHDPVFAQNRFAALNPEPTTLGTFGATMDPALDRALSEATGPAEADSILNANGRVRYDERRKAVVEDYLRVFFATLNERGSKETWISRLRAPHHIWSQRPDPVYRVQEPVAEVRMVYHRVWYDGVAVHQLAERTVVDIAVPMTRAEALGARSRGGAPDPE